ncbi:GGDEF domain-containing protein [Spiribacter halobius]|uniref:diguanylate cyclase n=1 Tax=Sediminicurvatus halobius TaxID=2182432 RepID=A0A2U2N702_9GAMM|nr:GGDEF domain-containing protein [Spiribacter halobius]PWG64862.1 hypothetical protein DEM34_03445 [Spiribacter halobius]UEX78283.1 GGDEF domain-containing protein [Spiribacter halobius]
MPSDTNAARHALLLPERTRAAVLGVWALALLPFIVISLATGGRTAALAGAVALLPAAFLLIWYRISGHLPPPRYTVPAMLAINGVIAVSAAHLPHGPSYWIFPFLALNFTLMGLTVGGLTNLALIAAGTWNVSLWAGGAETFTFLKTTLLLFVFVLFIWRALEESWQQLDGLAHRDELTGLGNRRALRPALDRVAEGEGVASVLMIDLDRFKLLNDRHGHAAGDEVLVRLGGLLREHLRASDSAYRVGGDELLVLLPETPLDGARQLAQRLAEAVAAADFRIGERIGVSIGVAERLPGERVEHWLQRADADLYRGKSAAAGGGV